MLVMQTRLKVLSPWSQKGSGPTVCLVHIHKPSTTMRHPWSALILLNLRFNQYQDVPLQDCCIFFSQRGWEAGCSLNTPVHLQKGRSNHHSLPIQGALSLTFMQLSNGVSERMYCFKSSNSFASPGGVSVSSEYFFHHVTLSKVEVNSSHSVLTIKNLHGPASPLLSCLTFSRNVFKSEQK